MKAAKQKPRLAVISPFLDRRHGSERVIVEWLAHLPRDLEIHIYAQQVEGIDREFSWHRIPKVPGPHLFNFLWWVVAVRLWIAYDRRFRGLRHDLIFSSGANYVGADVICVHIVFAAYIRQVKDGMRLSRNPLSQWARLIHRKLYYRVVNRIERGCYTNTQTALVANSQKTADEITRFYRRDHRIPVIYFGVDSLAFNPEVRASLRGRARNELKLSEGQFVLLLVGNDWRNKGVPVLLEALARLQESPIGLFVVSREGGSSCWPLVTEMRLDSRVRFLPPRDDIELYYAAADVYVGPSLQDSYAMPAAEAMACGLPVIVSATAGVSETISDGIDGLILRDPRDGESLAAMIKRLYENETFRRQLGERAAVTARKHTWQGNAEELAAIFNSVLRQKSECSVAALPQNP